MKKVGLVVAGFAILFLVLAIGIYSYTFGNVTFDVNSTCQISLPLTATTEQANNIRSDQLPVSNGFPVPRPSQPFSGDNASQVRQLARWGKGSMGSMVWSPTQELVAVASSRGVYLYNTENFVMTGYLDEPAGVGFIRFSPDGTELMTKGFGPTIHFWQVSNGRLIREWSQPRFEGNQIIVSAEGSLLAAGGYTDGTVHIWDVVTEAPVQEITTNAGVVAAMAFSSDGKMLATAGQHEIVQLWRIRDGSLIRELNKGHWALIDSLAFSPAGDILATGSFGGEIQLWRLSDGERIRKIDSSIHTVRNLIFSPDGSVLAANYGAYDPIKLWQVNSGRLLNGFSGDAVAFNPDGTRLSTTRFDEDLHIWRVSDGRLLFDAGGNTDELRSVAVSSENNLVVVSDRSGTIYFKRAADGGTECQLQAHRADARSLSLSPDGTKLVSIGFDRDIRLWQVEEGRFLYTLPEPGWVAQFSPDGRYLATGMEDGLLNIWTVEERSLVHELPGHREWTNDITFSPDSKLVAAGGDSEIKVWQVATGQLAFTLPQGSASVLAFSPDGQLLAANSSRGLVLWRLADALRLHTLEGHSNVVEQIAFSPDGQLVSSGSVDGSILLWRVDSGEVVNRLQGHASVNDFVFSADGFLLVSVGSEATVGIWGIPPEFPD